MKPRAKSTIAKSNMSIKQVMEIIQKQSRAIPPGPSNVACITDDNNTLLGIATDGDIRRALISSYTINDKISKIMNRNPIIFHKDMTPDDILAHLLEEIKRRKVPNKKLNQIILVDNKKRVYDVFTFFDLWKSTEVKTREFCIIGLGYVGLTLALILAESGYRVIGTDTNKKIINDLRDIKTRVHEKDITTLLSRHINKNFYVQDSLKNSNSDVYIVCVGTPLTPRGMIDLKPLKLALQKITQYLKHGDLIILRSTVSIGTCRNFVIPFVEKNTQLKAGEDFYVAFAPERTVEGDALNELRSLPQIIGGMNKNSTDLTLKVFQNITSNIVLVENLETAEMIKLLNNTYRDLNFAFANEIAMLCDTYNLDSYKVIRAANQGYSRSNIPLPGPGVGGQCLVKDPYILTQSAKKAGFSMKLPALGREINKKMIDFVCQKVDSFVERNKKNPKKMKIFAIGMAFKGHPETKDIRASTAIDIVRKLKNKYPNIYVYDPVVKKQDLKDIGLAVSTLEKGFENADCILILNNHPSYPGINIFHLLKMTKKPSLFFDSWHQFETLLIKPQKGIKIQGI